MSSTLELSATLAWHRVPCTRGRRNSWNVVAQNPPRLRLGINAGRINSSSPTASSTSSLQYFGRNTAEGEQRWRGGLLVSLQIQLQRRSSCRFNCKGGAVRSVVRPERTAGQSSDRRETAWVGRTTHAGVFGSYQVADGREQRPTAPILPLVVSYDRRGR